MGRKGSYAKGIAKREEILTAALEVIAREGYGHASLRELADAVGLTQAGVLHYFDSKEDLFVEVLRRSDQLAWARVGPPQGAETAERFLANLAGNTKEPGLTQLYVQLSAIAAAGEGPARTYLASRNRDFHRWVAEPLRLEREADPSFASGLEPLLATRVIMAVSDGLQNQWLMDPSFDLAAIVGHVIELLVRGGTVADEARGEPEDRS